MSRRVLIVSPHFPPTNAPDHQRVRMSLPYFAVHGWQPIVLALEYDAGMGPPDPTLVATLPAEVPVHRVRAFDARWARAFGIGNAGYRGWLQMAAGGDQLLRSLRIDLVYFSTTQYLFTTLGRRWKRRFRVPFVVDIQDPWRTDYYERPGAPVPPGGWKYRFARWQARRLEERSWREAAGFVAVSRSYLDQLRQRYGWAAGKPAEVIPFGASTRDFALAAATSSLEVGFIRQPGCVHLVSVGALGPMMAPALERTFQGIAKLQDEQPELCRRLRLNFIGTSYAPASRARETARPIARRYGVEHLVTEKPGRIGYLAALKTMATADALLVVGSDEPGYSPSKLAACALARRPTLAVAPAGSVAAHRISELGFAHLVAFTEADSAEAVAGRLSLLLNPLRDSNHERSLSPDAAESLLAENCTRRQAGFFDRLVAPPA